MMRESRENIDKLFNEKLNDRTFDIPDAFLSDLNNKLDAEERRKRKPNLIWFILPLFLGFAVFGYVKISNDDGVNESKHLAENRAYSTMKNVQEYTNQPVHQNRESDAVMHTQAMHNRESHSFLSSSTDDIRTNSAENREKGSPLREGRKFMSSESQVSLNDLSVVEDGNHMNEKSSHDRNSDSNSELAFQKNNSQGQKKAADSFTSYPNANDNYNPSLATDDTLKNIGEKVKTVYKDSVVVRDSVVIRDSLVIRDSVIFNPRKTNSTWSAELQVFGGFSGTLAKITSSNSEYVNKMRGEEQALYSTTFGFNINTNYKHWTLGSGIFYLQSGEKTNYSFQTENTYDSLYIIGYQSDSVFVEETQTWQIVDIPIYDSTSVTKIVDSVLQSGNHYSWLSVPLNFGYRFHIGSWSIIPRVGLNFDFAIANNLGRYPGVENSSLVAIPAKRFMFSYAIQLEVRKSFGHWFVYGCPYFRSTFVPGVSSDSLQRTYRNWGIRIGVGVRF